jgi:Ca2+:H+ antiporter
MGPDVRRRLANLLPGAALALLVALWGTKPEALVALPLAAIHVALVLTAVAHAEAIAHRVGEPIGTLVLALSVTVVEVALIITLMVSEGDAAATLARDTVFAAIMIVCNGVVGASLLAAARRSDTVRFSEHGSNALLGTLLTLATLSLVMPTFTSSSRGPTFSPSQLAFSAVAAATVYGIFIFAQTRRLRWMFTDAEEPAGTEGSEGPERVHHGLPISLRRHGVLLVVSLVGVIGFAKLLAPSIERAVVWAGAPQPFVGVVIALLVLLPESVAAFRAASRGQMQTSMNLALGSALASIGLTIPAIAVASIWVDVPIALGLGAKEIVLLGLTAVISVLTFGSGKATVLQATHHLAVFASFLFLSWEP